MQLITYIIKGETLSYPVKKQMMLATGLPKHSTTLVYYTTFAPRYKKV